jgi:hypothetical protein
MSSCDLGQFVDSITEKHEDSRRPPTLDIHGDVTRFEAGEFDRDRFPDLEGYGWEASIESYGPIEAVEYWHKKSKQSWNTDFDHEKIPGKGAVVLTGLEDYIKNHGLKLIDYPEHYTRFENTDPVFRWSADYHTIIDWVFLKRCVRLANGKGRIDTKETYLILGEHGVVIATGPRGAFVAEIPTATVRDGETPDPPEEVCSEVAGIELPEEHPHLRHGFKRFIELTNNSPYPSVAEYVEFDRHHELVTDGKEQVIVSENDLRALFGQAQSVAGVSGEYSTYCNGSWYDATVTEADLPGKIGTETTLSDEDLNQDSVVYDDSQITGIIGGYRIEWVEQKFSSLGTNRTRKLTLVARTSLITPELDVELVKVPLTEIDPTEDES